MSDTNRVVETANLSDQAWSLVNGTFFSPDFEGSVMPREVIAGDGALWRHCYLATAQGPAIRLERESDETVISFALHPTLREVAFVSINRRASFTDKIADLSLQTETGMTIPTGDDLLLLENFLAPRL